MIGTKFTSRYGFETSGSTILGDTQISGSLTDSFGNTGSEGYGLSSGISGAFQWNNQVDSSSHAISGSRILTGIETTGLLALVSSSTDYANLSPSQSFMIVDNDGTLMGFGDFVEGSFSSVYTALDTVNMTAFEGTNSCTFTASVDSVYGAGWDIRRAFIEGSFEHAVYVQLTADLQMNNFNITSGFGPNRFRHRGRITGAEYWQTCTWTITYTDASTETGQTTTAAPDQYHDYSFNADGSRIVGSIRCQMTDGVGTNPGFRDVDVFFPAELSDGLYLNVSGSIKTIAN